MVVHISHDLVDLLVFLYVETRNDISVRIPVEDHSVPQAQGSRIYIPR